MQLFAFVGLRLGCDIPSGNVNSNCSSSIAIADARVLLLAGRFAARILFNRICFMQTR
jgi:hypothetical protein